MITDAAQVRHYLLNVFKSCQSDKAIGILHLFLFS